VKAVCEILEKKAEAIAKVIKAIAFEPMREEESQRDRAD